MDVAAVKKYAYDDVGGIVVIPEDELREYDYPRWKSYLERAGNEKNYTFEVFLDEWLVIHRGWKVNEH